MNLIKINLTNFRNFKPGTQVELPRSGLLVATAPNAVGKTNFLESITVLLRGKTWRGKISECVKWGEEGFIIKGDIERQGSDDSRVSVYFHKPTKKLRIEEDGISTSLIPFYTNYPFVVLTPEDTFLLSRGPAQRRNLINYILVSHPGYLSVLIQYYRVLRQRNTALKKAISREDVAVWTDMLAEHAAAIWRHRENLVSYWQEKINGMYSRLSGEQRRFTINLVLGVRSHHSYTDELSRSFALDKKYGYTLYGPHRDDVAIATNQKSAATTMSRGQLKSLIIALKVLSHHYVKQITKEEPILLMDDVLSELDEQRQIALIENLPHTQTIITCTNIPSTLKNRQRVYLLDLAAIITTQSKKDKLKLSKAVSSASVVAGGAARIKQAEDLVGKTTIN